MPPPSQMRQAQVSGLPEWFALLRVGKSGKPILDAANVAIALAAAPETAGRFAYDEMVREIVVDTPVALFGGEATYPRVVDNLDVRSLQHWLQLSAMPTLTEKSVIEGLQIAAQVRRRHPLRDWLRDIPWDGQMRVDSWLARYLGAADTPYHAMIGTCFLVGMVARIFEPGCKMDYMLVLEGEQGSFKSTAARILAGESYFSDTLPDLAGDHVRASQHLRGKWLIEVPELSAFSRADANRLKSFITQTTEQYMPKYARLEANEPRQCVFIGTTNKDKYLRDETGGRRFWPVACSRIDLSALAAERELLLAEAVHHYACGTQHWPDAAFEKAYIVPAQQARYENDAWEEAIEQWREREQIKEPVSILRIANDALNFKTERLGTADQRRISAALEHLNWLKNKKTMHGVSWSPPFKSGFF